MAIQKFGNLMDDLIPQSFTSMLDRFLQDTMSHRSRITDFVPKVDTWETESGYEFEVALPGMKKEDIQIEFQEGRITISGERKFQQENKEKRYHLIESQYGSFSRSFYLPNNVDPDSIEASFSDGMLRVSIPKDQQKTLKHRIQIKEVGQAKKEQKRMTAKAQENGHANGQMNGHSKEGDTNHGEAIKSQLNGRKKSAEKAHAS